MTVLGLQVPFGILMVVLLQVEISKTIHADDKKVGNGLATDIKRSYQFNDNIDDDVNKKSSAYICRTLFFCSNGAAGYSSNCRQHLRICSISKPIDV